MENTAITGLAVNNDEAIITLNGVPHDIKVIGRNISKHRYKDINIDMISQTFPVNKLVTYLHSAQD
jgi:aspartate kinase